MRFLLLFISLWVVLCANAGCSGVGQSGAPAPVAPTSAPVAPTPPLSGDQITGGSSGNVGKGGPAACPRLDPVLYALATASDPAAFAAASNIPYDQGRVLVFITFTTPVDFDQYGASVTAQTDQLAQVLVPPNELCRLANDTSVTAVRPPDMAVPSRP
ncbi:MAG: hypothetical protein SNJ69_16395 [Chloroflexaceae bacterium]